MDRTEIDMRYCGSAEMQADGLTKGLAIGKHIGFVPMCMWRYSRRSSRDEDQLDLSQPLPWSQLRPIPPINLHQHHHHSHQSHHNHTNAAGIAALAANAVLAGNLTIPANSVFTGRQRLPWTLPALPSPPPITPSGSSHHRLHRPCPLLPPPKLL